MNARQKLNVAFLNGSLLIAAIAGAACQSPLIFILALIGLVVGNLMTGDIRLDKRNHRK